jgi:hypothetical protein
MFIEKQSLKMVTSLTEINCYNKSSKKHKKTKSYLFKHQHQLQQLQ